MDVGTGMEVAQGSLAGQEPPHLAAVGVPGLAEGEASGALQGLAEDGWDCSETKLSIQDVPERHHQGAADVGNSQDEHPVQRPRLLCLCPPWLTLCK